MGLSNYKKLLAYSGSASIFLLCNSVQSQVVYTDIDPDIVLYGDEIFDLDLNGDGIIDVQFVAERDFTWTSDSSSPGSGWSTQTNNINNFGFIAYTMGEYGIQILQLTTDDVINDATPFTNYSNIEVFSAYNEMDEGSGGVVFNDVEVYSGTSLIGIDTYIGLKIEISGEPHYGWVRIRLHQVGDDMPHLVIKDYAFDTIPNDPLEIDPYSASEAMDLVLKDISETNTAADLQLNFEKAVDESTISSYRIILYTGWLTPSLTEANTLSPELYTEIPPTGLDISLVFNEETRDISGNLLLPDTYYRAVVLSVADGITVSNNSLSTPSNACIYKLVNAHPVHDVDLIDIGNNKNITDLNVQFSTTSIIGIEEYRIIISNDQDLEIDTLLSLDSNYYKTIELDGLSYSFILDTTIHIYNCITPHLFERYYAYVISMPDGIFSTFASPGVYPGSRYFLYPDYEETPIITISTLTGTASDINFQFPKFNFEEDLEAYRIVVVKDEFYYLFQNADALDLPHYKYEDILPTGVNLNLNLPSSLKDTDGDHIIPGVAYRVIVFLKGAVYPEYCSKATPSEPFILSEPVVVETNLADNVIIIENNILFIQLANNIEQNLIVVNAMGQEVFQQNISTENKSIDLNFLTAGIYFCFFESNSSTQIFPITLH